MKTSYYIACYTKCKCTPEEYEEEAENSKNFSHSCSPTPTEFTL